MRLWLVLSVFVASAALAAPRQSVVLSGPAPLTRWLSKELSKRYTVKVASRPVPAMPTAKQVRDFTAPAGAVALVLCQASGQYITLQVLNGADGTPLDTVSLKAALRKLPRAMPRPQLAALMFALGSGKAPGREAPAPPPPEPDEVVEKAKVIETTPDEPPPRVETKKEIAAKKKKEEARPTPVQEVVEEQPPTESKASPHPAVLVWLGVGGFNRNFQWAGNPSSLLATSVQPFSGDISVGGSWYPGAHFTSSFLANLGVFISGDFGVGMVTRLGESRFAQSASRVRFGALVRLPVGERFTLVGHVGYSRHEVTTSITAVNDGAGRPNLPDVLFNGFRAGPGFRWRVAGSVELDALSGFQAVVGKGELAGPRYFPQATALAVDVGAGLSIEVVEHLRLRAGFEWQRYFVTLNAAEDSTFFARSASDQFITATASLLWVM